MPVYIDLHPAPQFDASLVTYCVVNFGRVKDGLAATGKQVRFESWQTAGPWPHNVGVTVPFLKTDIVIWVQISYYTNSAPNFLAMSLSWDGVTIGPFLEQYWNENGEHKTLSATYVLRSVAGGIHTLSQVAITGGILSDSADFLKQHYTYYEL